MIGSFAFAFASNTFAMSGLLIMAGISGASHLAADIGLIQSATTALFFSLSANARNIILSSPDPAAPVRSLCAMRAALILPLGLLSYLLCGPAAGTTWLIAILIIARRAAEWVAEIHLSEREINNDGTFAQVAAALQIVTFVLTCSAILFAPQWMVIAAITLWALAPLGLSASFLIRHIVGPVGPQLPWRDLIPNIGSTTVIGAGVYIFRLMLLVITGKNLAGDLYTAFAIGGMMSSIYAWVVGPSLVFGMRDIRTDNRLPAAVRLPALATVTAGALVALMPLAFPTAAILGKSAVFWHACSFSLIGGAVMLAAQHLRIRLLQAGDADGVFGADLIMNLLIIASVPFGYYLLGNWVLPLLYLWNSVLALLFYHSTRMGYGATAASAAVRTTVAILISFPLFFQTGHGVFKYTDIHYNFGGVLLDLPIPISVLGCFGGILAFGAYRRSIASLLFIFCLFSIMTILSLITTGAQTELTRDKLIFMLQFILPCMGLITGQLFVAQDNDRYRYRKVFTGVGSATMFAMLASAWFQGGARIRPWLGLFSIYQSLQYVPVILMTMFMLGLFSLHREETWYRWLVPCSFVAGMFAIGSISMSTIGLAFIGTVTFISTTRTGSRRPLLLASLVAAGMLIYFPIILHSNEIQSKMPFLKGHSKNIATAMPNIAKRLDYWSYLIGKMRASGPCAVVAGQVRREDRTKIPSAHNYYLDLTYNFGLVSLIPIMGFMWHTGRRLWQSRTAVRGDPALLGLALCVVFLLVVDNNLKVGLRQPYPGIITWFLWGALLSELHQTPKNNILLNP